MEVESDPSLLEDVEEYHFDMDVEAEFSLGHSIPWPPSSTPLNEAGRYQGNNKRSASQPQGVLQEHCRHAISKKHKALPACDTAAVLLAAIQQGFARTSNQAPGLPGIAGVRSSVSSAAAAVSVVLSAFLVVSSCMWSWSCRGIVSPQN